MVYTMNYSSPLGEILLAADDIGLTGVWFYGQKYFAHNLPEESTEGTVPALIRAKEWLDIYFGGDEPNFTPPLHIIGTDFQREVWDILLKIPYGETVTYGEIARELAEKKGCAKMSAQAVGGAVGHNNIPIIIPCHRVVGASGNLTGYAGGIDRKVALLTLEKADMSCFFVPEMGTAL